MFSLILVLIAICGNCSAHIVKLNDVLLINDTDLFIRDSSAYGTGHRITTLRDILNPFHWLRKLFEILPELGFWLLGVTEYDCRYLTVCQTSNFLINSAPQVVLSWLNGVHTGPLSQIVGETPYIEAWSIGSIKAIDCNVLYDCPNPPFSMRSFFA